MRVNSSFFIIIDLFESVKAAAVKRLPFFVQVCLGTAFRFSYGVKTASTPSTLSTTLKKRCLYILHTFYNPSTFFYKLKKNVKPSTKCFIFYSISTLVENEILSNMLIINCYLIL